MNNRFLLEISVESAERAVAAERGGADRLELCSNLAAGGLTPPAELMRSVRACVSLPVFAMVRPLAGSFVYADEGFEQMKRDISLARECRMDGVVLGLLRDDGGVDARRTRELVQLAKPLPVTFHRAFDECADPERALREVIASGCTRILTSGGLASAFAGRDRLAKLIRDAGKLVTILAGGGITAANAAEIARSTGATEFHAALSSVAGRGSKTAEFEREVAKLAAKLRDASSNQGLD
ncbi:MAG TPA: copper homeostasis protein CutC [Candidatus Acidoferrum sp.]|nr:copper homeostasis protein CutC [Candidatus Acidoferrum sp.]